MIKYKLLVVKCHCFFKVIILPENPMKSHVSKDFKAKYMPFFVEDYRCLTQDDDSGNQHCWLLLRTNSNIFNEISGRHNLWQPFKYIPVVPIYPCQDVQHGVTVPPSCLDPCFAETETLYLGVLFMKHHHWKPWVFPLKKST